MAFSIFAAWDLALFAIGMVQVAQAGVCCSHPFGRVEGPALALVLDVERCVYSEVASLAGGDYVVLL
jgi:hypothetical protein